MPALLFFVLLVVMPSIAWGQEKEYPLTVKVLETDATSYKTDGTQTDTVCRASGSDQVDCTSTKSPGALHTDLTSVVEVSDGNTYRIACSLGRLRSALVGSGQAMQTNAGLGTVSGCAVPPGTYRARWEKGNLKIVHYKAGKSKETAFTVLSSHLTSSTVKSPPSGASGSDTVLQFASDPAGADIELDGNFVGQTPSSVAVAAGEHAIKITKKGRKPWERKLTTSGGTVSLSAELEPEN